MKIKIPVTRFLLAALFLQFFILPPVKLAQEVNKSKKKLVAPSISYKQNQKIKQPLSNYERLRKPEVFNQLSSAGQRAVLMEPDQLINKQHQSINRFSSNVSKNIPIDADLMDSPIGNPIPLAQGDDNIRVNDPTVNPGLTQSESSIAARGNNVVVSFNNSPGDTEQGSSGYGFSTNGGQTFTQGVIPNPPDAMNLGDGVVAFGPNGELYYATLTLFFGNTGIRSTTGVAKSTDQGATFSIPVDASTTAGNNIDFQDKEWLIVDNNANSPFKGNVYLSWTTFSEDTRISFARSTDGGQTYSTPINLSAQLSQGNSFSSVQGSMPAVAPNGDLYVAYYRVVFDENTPNGDQTISIVKSTDGGRTFSTPKSIASIFDTSNLTGGIDGSGVRTNSFPSIAVDQKGTVHIVYGATSINNLLPTGTDRSDVFYIRSTNAGNTFSSPIKINDDVTSTSQALPSLAIAADGTVGVRWWDRRNDPIFDSLTDVYMTTSTNGGASFGSNFQVNNHNWSFGALEGGIAPGYHGDYDALTAFDRPYKKAVDVTRAIDILNDEAGQGKLDKSLLKIFIEAKIFEFVLPARYKKVG